MIAETQETNRGWNASTPSAANISPRRHAREFRCDSGGNGEANDASFRRERHAPEGLRPSRHRQQAQKQHLIERIDHFSRMSRISQKRNMIKKNMPSLKAPLSIPSEGKNRNQLRFLCHGLFRPIAFADL